MKSLRSWATPLTIAAFLIMGVTGVLMFFHLETTLGKVIHEWAGWLLVIGVGAHLILNWRAFSTYFRRPLPATIMGVGALMLALTFLPVGPSQDSGDISRIAVSALSGGQIETLAALAGSDTATVLAELGAAGIEAQAADTPASLSGGDRMAQMQIITTIFAQ